LRCCRFGFVARYLTALGLEGWALKGIQHDFRQSYPSFLSGFLLNPVI